MLKTIPLVVCLCVSGFCSYLSAELIDDVYPELTELQYEKKEALSWQINSERLFFFYNEPAGRFQARQNWQPSSRHLTSRYFLQSNVPENISAPDLYLLFAQNLSDAEKPLNFGQVCVQLHGQNWLREIALGNFRLQAGEGLCLGNCGNSITAPVISLHPAPGLSHPSMNGAAIQTQFQALQTVIWFSSTSRLAHLQEGKISRLYESSLTDYSNKETVSERSGGALAAYNFRHLQFGGLFYSQNYDHPFVPDTDFVPNRVSGIFLKAEHSPLIFNWEADWNERQTAQAAKLTFLQSNLHQSLQFIQRPNSFPLPYDYTSQVFGSQSGKRELSWDITYRPVKILTLKGRFAAVNDLTETSDTKWKERTVLSSEWHEQNWRYSMTWYRFQKDALAVQDSVYRDLLPQQNRLQLNWRQRISPNLDYNITCQYQHYLTQNFTKNGISLLYGLAYHQKTTDWRLSFLTWTNQKSNYQPMDYPSDEELLLQSDTDSAFRFQFRQRLNKVISFAFSAYRPLKNISKQTYGLNLQAAW